ncbi:MAG: hypothetical protein ABJA81_06535 [Nocardioidaceae bacterium]
MTATIAGPRLLTTPSLRRLTAVACLFGAEAVHVSVMDEHMTEWLPAGVFFLVLAIAEGLLSVALITTPARSTERLAIAVSLGAVALWVLSRTVGIPIGPMAGAAEPIGRADLAASTLELMTAALLLARTDGPRATRNSATVYWRAALIVCAVVALTLFGVTHGDPGDEAPPDLTPSVPAGAGS